MKTSMIAAAATLVLSACATATLPATEADNSEAERSALGTFGEATAIVGSAEDSGIGDDWRVDPEALTLEILELTGADGTKITAFMRYPKDGLDPASPGLVFHHGGPGGHGARLIGAGRYAAEGLAEKGYTTITIVSRHSNNYVDEPLEHSAYDVEAAVNALKMRGVDDIVLVGNSMGSIRVALYMRDRPDPSIRAMVHVAPTYDLDAYTRDLSSIAGEPYAGVMADAEAAVARGDGRLPSPEAGNPNRLATPPLFQNGFGRPHTAAVFLNWWGQGEGRGPALSRLVPDFEVPQLYMGGSADRVTPPERMKLLADLSVKAGRADYIVYEDGDHYFSGYQQEVIDDIASWLDEIGLAPAPRVNVDFIDTLQQVDWNGVMFTTRSPGLLYEPESVDAETLAARPAFLILPDHLGALLDEDMDDLARAIASTGHAVVVGQLQSDGFRGSQNASFERVRGDLAAWQEAASKRGYDNMIGIGLGQGAIWLADDLTNNPDSELLSYIMINAPTSLRTHLIEGIGEADYQAHVDDAETLISTGTDRDRVLHIAYQSPFVSGPAGLMRIIQYAPTFLELYGPDASTDIVAALNQAETPTLLLAGPNRFYQSQEAWAGVEAGETVTVEWREGGVNSPADIADAISAWLQD